MNKDEVDLSYYTLQYLNMAIRVRVLWSHMFVLLLLFHSFIFVFQAQLQTYDAQVLKCNKGQKQLKSILKKKELLVNGRGSKMAPDCTSES